MSSKTKILFLAIVVCVFGLWLYVNIVLPPQFKAVFLDVGQGDSTLIFLPDGAKILVDCGPNQKILRKLGIYLNFFDRQIDYLIVTHPDADHYAGCLDVLRNYKVKNVFINSDIKENDPLFAVWQNYLQEEKTNIIVISGPVNYFLNKAHLRFFNPDPSLVKTNDINDNSLVFKLSYNTTTIFFAADMGVNLEKQLILKYCLSSTIECTELKSDYLKVAHHGSDSSSSENFLKAVNPQKAIISVGRNKYGHPSLRILKRLQRLGIEFLRTDQKGDIIVK